MSCETAVAIQAAKAKAKAKANANMMAHQPPGSTNEENLEDGMAKAARKKKGIMGMRRTKKSRQDDEAWNVDVEENFAAFSKHRLMIFSTKETESFTSKAVLLRAFEVNDGARRRVLIQ